MNYTIHLEGESYGPWGDVGCRNGYNAYGIGNCRSLCTALLSIEDRFLDWQCTFPQDVVDEVVRYPQAHLELLEMAYLMPERFVELSRQCPSLVAVASAFWLFCEDYGGARPDSETVSKFWGWFFAAPKRQVLARLGFGGYRSNFKLLSRIHVVDCDLASLFEVRYVATHPETRQIVRYLSDLNRVVRVLLRWGYRDFHLLELAAREPELNGERLYSVVADISELLARIKVDGWPYEGAIRSWRQALRIRSRLLARVGEDAFVCSVGGAKFPPPPLAVADPGSGLSLAPIERLEELEKETESMRNCAVIFASNVSSRRDVYFYQLVSPVRATVQLVKLKEGEWALNQVVGYANSELSEDVRAQLQNWVSKVQGGEHAAE